MMGVALFWAEAGWIEGVPIPYVPRVDSTIILILLGCFCLSAYIVFHSRKFLLQLMRNFLLHRERTTIFASSTTTEMRYLFLLILQTCVLGGLFFFYCSVSLHPDLLQPFPSYVLIGIYIAACLLYLFFKWLLYSFLGWIFFDKSVTSFWFESYFTLLYYLGFSLFTFLLFIIYFNLNLQIVLLLGLFLLIFTKILMFYKWLKLFSDNMYGILLLILYFCAVEIIPCFLAYQGIVELNEYLTIKF